MDEEVLVFPTSALERVGKFHGVCTDIIKYKHLWSPSVVSWMRRSVAETDANWKQIIPYCVLRYKGMVFTYQRTKHGRESRLHDKCSLGIGGHINPCDADALDCYYSGLQRELDEEIDISCAYRNHIVGLVYDDTTSVGQVHFGIVHRLTLESMEGLTCKDAALTNGEWKDTIWLKKNKELFERWSQFVIEALL